MTVKLQSLFCRLMCDCVRPASCKGTPAVVIGGKARAAHQMAGLELEEAQAGMRDQALDRPVQVAAPGQPPPYGRQAVLPARHARLGGAPVLDEQQAAAWAQDTPDFR